MGLGVSPTTGLVAKAKLGANIIPNIRTNPNNPIIFLLIISCIYYLSSFLPFQAVPTFLYGILCYFKEIKEIMQVKYPQPLNSGWSINENKYEIDNSSGSNENGKSNNSV